MKKFRKPIIAFLLCGLIGNPVPGVQAASSNPTVNYQTYNDATTGRQVEYFDLGEHTARTYVTQNAWFQNNQSFIVSSYAQKRIYKYNTSTHTVEGLFDDTLPLDNAAVVGPDDTVYAKNNSDGNVYSQKLGEVITADQLTVQEMTLTDSSSTAKESMYTSPSGLSFRVDREDRWKTFMTISTTRGGKDCLATVCQRRGGSGDNWVEYFSWFSSRVGTLMGFQVDNTKLSADTRNVTIEFEYYDDPEFFSNSNYSDYRSIECKYLAYNNGGTPTKSTASFATGGSGTWKTAKIELTDAQFNHADGVIDGAFSFDFALGMGGNRGGLAVTSVKVYQTPTNYSEGEVSFEVNSAGTGYTGDLTFRRWIDWSQSGCYDRMIAYSGEAKTGSDWSTSVLAPIDGKYFTYNVEYTEFGADTNGWKRWRNRWHFDVPDNFLQFKDYNRVEVEVEYYAPSISGSTGGTVSLFVNSDNTEYTKTVSCTGQWETLTYTIDKNDGKNATFNNGYYSEWDDKGYSDICIMPKDCQLYIHKVTVRKVNPTYKNLGNALGSWLPHVANNGDLSLVTGNEQKVVIYEAAKKSFAAANVWGNVTHAIINPVYPNLVLYNREKSAELEFFRINVLDRNKSEGNGRRVTVFHQYNNLTGDSQTQGATTGEAIGHEDWTPDGEHIVAVKYAKSTNIGKNGIVIMDKDGSNRRYINDDYEYLHCNVSPDGKWVVADTDYVSNTTKIVLINIKTGKSYLLANPTLLDKDIYLDGGQIGDAHPAFNLDGTKVTFAMKNPSSNILGVGMLDITDIISADASNQIAEPVGATTFMLSQFNFGFNKDTGRNQVSANITNIDGTKRAMTLFAAVYDAQGKLISVNKQRYNDTKDATLGADIGAINDAQTVKAFVWDDNNKPVQNSTDTIKNLRVLKVATNEVVLSWDANETLPIVKYEVFNGNTKIGETPYKTYRATGLTKQTEYSFYVRPIYDYLSIGEDAANITADIDDINFEGVYCATGFDVEEDGLSFWNNVNNPNALCFTRIAQVGGEYCRQAITVNENDVVEIPGGTATRTKSGSGTGEFYFGCDDAKIRANTNNVLIGIRYYDSDGRPSNAGITLNYIKTDDSIGAVSIVPERARDNTWKNATILLTDAKFTGNSDWADFDFKFVGGYNTFVSRAWVVPVDALGNPVSSSTISNLVTGAKAGIKVTTDKDSVSATLKEQRKDMVEDGLSFVWNDSDETSYGYTESQNENGVACRQHTSDEKSMLCFNVDKDIISERVSSIDFTVKYYNYNSNGGTIKLYYTGTDGTEKSVSIASPDSVSAFADKSWKTKTVSVTDAKLIKGLCDGCCDFYIKGASGTKIASVTVTKKSTPAVSTLQFAEWNTTTDATSGLSRISGGEIDEDTIYINSTSDWLKFNVDDTFMYGKSNNMAWVEITYVDDGENNIYLYYNTSDSTGTANKADKQAETVITCTDTGADITVRIPLIDACFSGFDGYDFRIGTDYGATIKNVRVIGY